MEGTIINDIKGEEESIRAPTTPWKLYVLMAFTFTLIISGAIIAYYNGLQFGVDDTTYIDTLMLMQIKITSSHLWFEEILVGDTNEDISSVMESLDEVDTLSKLLLEGGVLSDGREVDPITNAEIRNALFHVRDDLVVYREMTQKRYDTYELSGPGTAIDQEYDSNYHHLMSELDYADELVHEMIKEEIATFRITVIGIISLSIFMAGIVGVQMFRFEKERTHDFNLIQQSREEVMDLNLGLEEKVNDRTEKLEDQKQELAAMNEELVSSNEELQSSEEELTAMNEELQAAQDELSDANKGLEAKIEERTDELLETNKQLREEMSDRKRAQGEVETLNVELEERVEKRTSQLESANQELEAFAYSVSHDLRAPLRGIDGFSKVLLENYLDVLDDKGQDYLHRVRRGSQRMGELIDDLLMLSRSTSGELTIGEVNLSDIAQDIIAMFQENEPERSVEFSASKGIVVKGDPKMLKIVLENLLGNAWKFTAEREPGSVEFGVSDIEGRTTYFVKDNGAGFDMKYSDKLFGPFQRLHKMEEFPGSGIGLATVQRIIHRHGGEIWGEGELDKGATFYFTFDGRSDE